MRSALLLTTLLALGPARAWAVPRRAAAPRRAPAQVATLEVAGLVPGDARRFHAVLHAIRRDALPAVATCVAGDEGARGVLSVTLSPRARGADRARVSGRFSAAFMRCVREASAAIALPPRELDEAVDGEREADDEVRFELRVRLPSLRSR